MSDKSGLEEYQEALARANADRRDASTSTPHRPRGIALGLLGLVVLALSLGVVFYDWYRQANDIPASGTIVAIQNRDLDVTFMDASGVRLTAHVFKYAREPLPQVGEQRDILYLEGLNSDGTVSAWDPKAPPMSPIVWFIAVAGLGVLAAGVLEFSGRAPWRYAVWLDERSVGTSPGGDQ
ncbi:hypothetical protein [Herbidospora mongoliensis]|uniref:hypothetical protein n=1 Tax=Herbidospora mongoliensis TaxID=688067 RepID=UPI000832053E|nr:hypothetical protein [Herbidospora mongoliensis]